MRLFSIKILIS
ncbi:unnamed protein product, partial [Allacma fusca]